MTYGITKNLGAHYDNKKITNQGTKKTCLSNV